MTTATITTATVKYAASNPKDYGNGPRINVLTTLASGEEVKLWGNAGDQALLALRKKQSVQLLFDGKGYKLLESTPTAPQSAPGHSAPEDSEAVFDEALKRASRRICKAIRNAKVVAEREYGITEGMVQADIAAAAIVKETAAALLIEAGKISR
ncbi:MAG: hypothetical protein AAFY26_25905 [Cyanobacteria bacterium J06638_22]